ncbi:hypothetical protein GXM_09272 [Nostoc sphaeroides CCNUC1]|uniref:Uncharacterized protein n=1 Tax=Nostoc sphaeroides CCNUC1 TaxID=2653204 RepID=A0A5P8WG75_9NOSO|nr:hypothetical protein GXM_09272 [Nostoc sphaeroides CCNUC1]
MKACSLSSWRDIRLLYSIGYVFGLCPGIFNYGSFFPKPSDRPTSNSNRTLTETISNEKKCDRILLTSR